jgi:two-component system phosphate regulon response regulator PhoB
MEPPPTVLVADDDPAVLALMRDLLDLEDCDMVGVGVGDGQLAMEALDLSTLDLVILDVMMPRHSEIEVLRGIRARADTKGIPVVIVSAKRDEESVWLGLQTGCDHYVTKPFDPCELAAVIRRMLGRPFFGARAV